MEVLSIIANTPEMLQIFWDFMQSYDRLLQQEKDDDTIYYSKGAGQPLEMYFHYTFVNSAEELSYNYSKEEVKKIKDYFLEQELFIFDVSYRDEAFLKEMLENLKKYFILKNKEYFMRSILISHPFKRIVFL